MRNIQIFEIGPEYDVHIISNDTQHALLIERHLQNGEFFADSASGEYANPKVLSEALRDAIGYGPAKDLLLRQGVAESDPLMYLGVHN